MHKKIAFSRSPYTQKCIFETSIHIFFCFDPLIQKWPKFYPHTKNGHNCDPLVPKWPKFGKKIQNLNPSYKKLPKFDPIQKTCQNYPSHTKTIYPPPKYKALTPNATNTFSRPPYIFFCFDPLIHKWLKFGHTHTKMTKNSPPNTKIAKIW